MELLIHHVPVGTLEKMKPSLSDVCYYQDRKWYSAHLKINECKMSLFTDSGQERSDILADVERVIT
jgi:hypothetical protein